MGDNKIEAPAKRTFDAEGAILKQVLSDCLRDRHTALAQLADAARGVDQAAFGSDTDFPQAHQALLRLWNESRVCYKVEPCAGGTAERPEKKS